MKKVKRTLLTLVCAGALVVGSVAATMAYLTDEDVVENTFTVGNVAITLDERDVDNDANDADNVTIDGVVRDKANLYKLMPGQEYVKDPIVRVAAGSENCFVYIKLANGLEDIIDATTIEDQMLANGWALVAGSSNVYYYEDVVGQNMNIPVFNSFKVKSTVTNTSLAAYADKSIKVTAYAVQSDGFSSADAAWVAAKSELGA